MVIGLSAGVSATPWCLGREAYRTGQEGLPGMGAVDLEGEAVGPNDDPPDASVEIRLRFIRRQVRPALCDHFGTRDQRGMGRYVSRIVLNDLAHRSCITEPTPETGHDEGLKVRGRNAPAPAAGLIALGDEVAGDIVVVAPSLLDGVARRQAFAMLVHDQAGEQAGPAGPSAALAVCVGGRSGWFAKNGKPRATQPMFLIDAAGFTRNGDLKDGLGDVDGDGRMLHLDSSFAVAPRGRFMIGTMMPH